MKIIKSTFVTLNALPKISDNVYEINGKKKTWEGFLKEYLGPLSSFSLTWLKPNHCSNLGHCWNKRNLKWLKIWDEHALESVLLQLHWRLNPHTTDPYHCRGLSIQLQWYWSTWVPPRIPSDFPWLLHHYPIVHRGRKVLNRIGSFPRKDTKTLPESGLKLFNSVRRFSNKQGHSTSLHSHHLLTNVTRPLEIIKKKWSLT